MNRFSTPILFMAFNRPEITKISFEVLRKLQPKNLYIAIDGPRLHIDGETEKCDLVKSIVKNVDWDCYVKFKFNTTNLGCKNSVKTAIDWLFENEEQGIILEDDILPSNDFFYFCECMLERFADDIRIGLISGCNLVSKNEFNVYSYLFSRYPNIWGWATWKRVWKEYDVNMNGYIEFLNSNALDNILPKFNLFKPYWKNQLDSVYYNRIDTWDFQFYFMMWKNNYLSIAPTNNQILNLGYNKDATHTNGNVPKFILDLKIIDMVLPLCHNLNVKQNVIFDIIISKIVYQINLFTVLKWKIRYIPFLGINLSKIRRYVRK
uniref:nucleotide-diphospho-sugar transferase n=1 Tax=Algoriphagus sp. TaxID=1872435 RepID=UPI00404796F4